MTQPVALIVGDKTAFTQAAALRLAADGFTVAWRAWTEALPGQPPPAAILLAPTRQAGLPADATAVEEFLLALDAAFVPAGLVVRDLVAQCGPRQPARIVVLADWSVTGPANASTAAAVMGGLVGLARSWALEFAALGATANAVLVGPDAGCGDRQGPTPPPLVAWPTAEAVAHAVASLVDPRAACITGQVLAVCGGRTPAALPV